MLLQTSVNQPGALPIESADKGKINLQNPGNAGLLELKIK
jgi:hypothetical protein